MRSPSATRWTRLVLILLAVILALGRFARLEGDFPWSVTRSCAPLTDEGWYSNAPVRQHVSGFWYLPGDVNEAVVQPTFHLIQAVNIGLLGLDLTTIRLPGALLFCALVLLAHLMLARELGPWPATLSSLLLAGDFLLFAYSRIAMVELPMMCFVFLSAYLLLRSERARPEIGSAAAGVAFAAACLTKPSALFALPALAWLAWQGAGATARKRLYLFAVSSLGPVAAVYGLALARFPTDLVAYREGLSGRFDPSPMSIFDSAARVVFVFAIRQPALALGLALATAALLVSFRRIERWRLPVFLYVGLGSYVALISSSIYHPTRYLLPLVTLAIPVLCAGVAILFGAGRRVSAALLVVFLLYTAAQDVGRIGRYFAGIETRYRDFTLELATTVRRSVAEPVLMGDMAPQLSLATGLPGLSGRTAPAEIAWLQQEHGATHYVDRRPLPRSAVESLAAPVELVRTYRIVPRCDPIYLYRFDPTGAGGSRPSSP